MSHRARAATLHAIFSYTYNTETFKYSCTVTRWNSGQYYWHVTLPWIPESRPMESLKFESFFRGPWFELDPDSVHERK
jgi:hypothetical protein